MKRTLMTGAAALTLLLGGCATVVSSDVTTFHQWPAQIADKSYAFVAPAPQDDTLELRAYQNLVRGQLGRLGFREATDAPALKVSMRFMTTDIPVRVIEPMFPEFSPYSRFGFYHGFGPRRFGGFYGSPFYGSYWGMPAYEVTEQHRYQRQLQVAIMSARNGEPLFDVTVRNTSRTMSTPKVMPALVQSAFEGFPGPNGAARRIELKQNG